MEKSKFIWTEDKIKYLLLNWEKESAHSMKNKFGCSWQTVANKAAKLGLSAPKSEKWTVEEENELRTMSTKYHYKRIAKKLGKTENAIILKARKLKIVLVQDWRKWTKAEEQDLKKHWGNYSIERIAQMMGRSIYAIKVKATRMALGYMSQHNGKQLSISDISKILNVRSERISSTWLKTGLTAKKKSVTKNHSYYCVEVENLLLFLENHQDLWNSVYLEKNIFGEEPEWLLAKRKFDVHYGAPHEYRVWSQREINIARDLLLHGYDYEYISEQINRSPQAIAYKMRELGLSYRLKCFWKGPELKAVIENYPFMQAKEISGKLIHRSVKAIQYKAAEMGVRKRTLKRVKEEENDETI